MVRTCDSESSKCMLVYQVEMTKMAINEDYRQTKAN